MKFYLTLNADEVHNKIPYSMVCMAKEGARWNTGRRKRMWDREFTDAEKAAAANLFKLAHKWTLVSGVPATVKMTPKTFFLWQKLGNFCSIV